MEKGFGRLGAVSLLLMATTVGLTSGCATKRYVRTEVNTSANELSARVEERDRQLQEEINANSNQIGELSEVTREHTHKISSLDSGLKSTDSKASEAMNAIMVMRRRLFLSILDSRSLTCPSLAFAASVRRLGRVTR